jgi:hypothetical protein
MWLCFVPVNVHLQQFGPEQDLEPFVVVTHVKIEVHLTGMEQSLK